MAGPLAISDERARIWEERSPKGVVTVPVPATTQGSKYMGSSATALEPTII
jgi:hypothetical protein